ncbi:Coenzyme F420:L-glutamate ligase [Metallosphaera sp. J1]|uniref:5,6-dimethylbenzimidazole synthase n=1 Tax=Metallosphaera javensis (ex Hofmann et al. 2022) TaxID=99938 RepID=UPI001EDDBA26|nr:5,6-dimethylbenzimidazole synthase [Metallosphaera javensis (ex Hofmann et al. 2022)]MCG3109103.1 Coenzyme F420:L-glutamate ligase [Metallosphaera javensis (ex Hofmann et al. 2022)]
MDLYEAIKGRRDIRSYFKPDPIPNEVLSKILLAAHLAPSVGYSQPWNFILVKDADVRRKVKEEAERQRARYAGLLDEKRRSLFNTIKIEGIMEAPLNLAVTADCSRFGPHVLGRITMPETCQYSVVLAIENLWLAARAENIGVGWVSFLDKEKVKEILSIPKEIDLVAYLTMGYVTSFPEKPELEQKGWNTRLPLSELVFQDAWGRKPNDDLIRCLKDVRL